MKPPFYKHPMVLTVFSVFLILGAFGLAKYHFISFAVQGILTAIAVGIQVMLYRQKK
ncbi:hypothetical protein [Spirosoma aerophilum]